MIEAAGGEHFPEHDGGGVDVGRARRLPGDLLGRHVRDLALEAAFARRLQAAGGLRDAEVEDAREPVRPDEDVLRGHVAVDDPERLAVLARRLVRGVEAFDRAEDDRCGDGNGNADAALAQGAEQARERLALHVLHDEKELAFEGDDVERADDVGMTDAGRDARLVEEHRDEVGLLGELGMEPLDGDGPREADGPEEAPDVHGGHAAGRDLVMERVAADHAHLRQR